MRNVTILLAVMVMLAATAQAGVITYEQVNTDADCGISSSINYLHKLDMGTGPVAVVNGVTFDNPRTPHDGSSFNYKYETASTGALQGFAVDKPNSTTYLGMSSGEAVYELFADYHWHQSHNQFFRDKVTLSGLTVGTEYETRLYCRSTPSFPQVMITFDTDKGGAVADDVIPHIEGRGDKSPLPAGWGWQQTYSITYNFTADSDELWIDFDELATSAGGAWWIPGITTEVIPEPATMVLLGIGGIGVLLRRKRR